MNEPRDERPGFLDRPGNVRRLFTAFYVLCGLLVLLEVVVDRHEAHPWEGLPAFYPLYGFVSIVVLVLLAKLLRRAVMRPEDYYEPEDDSHGLG